MEKPQYPLGGQVARGSMENVSPWLLINSEIPNCIFLTGSPGDYSGTLLHSRVRMNLPRLPSVARLKVHHKILGCGHLLMLGRNTVKCPDAMLFLYSWNL